jgi:hypothetical protein
MSLWFLIIYEFVVLIFLFAAGRMSNPGAGRWCPQVPRSVLLLYGAIVSSWSSGHNWPSLELCTSVQNV